MSGDTAQHAGILVLHLALDDSLTERLVIGRRRNPRFPCCWRIEPCLRHSERPEYFALAEEIDRLSRNSLQRQTEQDESNIAVFNAGSRRIPQRSGKALAQQFAPSGR